MCANSTFRDELYTLLYRQSLFVVHTFNSKRPQIQTLSERARSYITHLVISYNAIEPTKEFFKVPSYPQALNSAIDATVPLVPNLRYFGINLWSTQFVRIFPSDLQAATTAKPWKEKQDDRVDFRETSFLTRPLIDLIKSRPAMESFVLWRDMQPRGQLDWNRNKDNVRKALARDIKKCMKKVYEL
jgi:hypothetical protein